MNKLRASEGKHILQNIFEKYKYKNKMQIRLIAFFRAQKPNRRDVRTENE